MYDDTREQVNVIFDNSLNTSEKNPPGFIHRIGILSNDLHGKGVIEIPCEGPSTKRGVLLKNNIQRISVWYKEYGWNSSDPIIGPFEDGQVIILPKITPLKAYGYD
jgi:hypothetical protein